MSTFWSRGQCQASAETTAGNLACTPRRANVKLATGKCPDQVSISCHGGHPVACFEGQQWAGVTAELGRGLLT